MQIDRKKFLDGYTAAFGAPSQGKTDGINALLAAAEGDMQITDIRWLAYMLATVKHECADTWRAIEEYGKGKGHKYGNPVTVTDPSDGKTYTNVYYGRGYVQLTWDYNYRSMGQALSNRLLYEPQLALDPMVAYKIMSYGMRKGAFTGKKLSDYINAAKCDYVTLAASSTAPTRRSASRGTRASWRRCCSRALWRPSPATPSRSRSRRPPPRRRRACSP